MKWFLFLITFISTVACSSKVTISEEEASTEVLYIKDSYKPYTGKCIVLFRDSKMIKEQFTFKDGILNGEAVSWYKSGQVRRKGTYSEGQVSGKWFFWDEQGNKTMEASYKNDCLNGAYIALYTNGKVKEKGQFSANDRTGKWSYYDDQGQLLRVVTK